MSRESLTNTELTSNLTEFSTIQAQRASASEIALIKESAVDRLIAGIKEYRAGKGTPEFDVADWQNEMAQSLFDFRANPAQLGELGLHLFNSSEFAGLQDLFLARVASTVSSKMMPKSWVAGKYKHFGEKDLMWKAEWADHLEELEKQKREKIAQESKIVNLSDRRNRGRNRWSIGKSIAGGVLALAIVCGVSYAATPEISTAVVTQAPSKPPRSSADESNFQSNVADQRVIEINNAPETDIPDEVLVDINGPWGSARTLFSQRGIEADDAQIAEAAAELARTNGFSAPSLGVESGEDSRTIPQGKRLKLSDRIKSMIRVLVAKV